MRHRNDIDGLRAFAIVPVVLFHYGLSQVAPGGFVGVDIFFVISGFLITRNINEGIQNGTYSILDFYNRRIRRIFPALFVMFLFCSVFSLLLEFPGEAKDTNQSIVASIFFVSNIFFFNMSGYFDQALQSNPLLHTWSLSVEEQFYVVVPVFLYLIRNVQKVTRVTLFFLALILSFLLSLYAVYHDKTGAFYLVQNRAWELLTGSVLALDSFKATAKKLTLEVLGGVGLLLIVGSVVLLNKSSLFPGPGALAPCLGAALILYSGATYETYIARFLAWIPLRFIGLVSYSFYLWHWPVLVFYGFVWKPHGFSKLALIGVAFALAVLSWRFIEQPFRSKPFRFGPRGTVITAAALMAAMSVVAFVSIPLNNGLWKYSPQVNKLLASMQNPDAGMRNGTCFLTSGADNFKLFQVPTCLAIDPARKNYLLIGDSHAAHLWFGLSAAYPGVNFLQANASGCKPIAGTPGERRCTDLRQFIFDDFIPHHHLDGIILSANWDDNEISAAIATAQTFRPYATRVVIFGPSAVYDRALPRILARSVFDKNPAMVAQHLLPEQKKTDEDFTRRMAGTGLAYVSVYSAMCPNSQCLTEAGSDISLQSDAEHFTQSGSVLIAKRINFLSAPVNSQ